MKKLGQREQFQQKFHLYIFRNKCIGLSFYCWKTYFSKLYSSFVHYSQSANPSMIQNNSNFIIVLYLLLVVEWRSWGHASSSVLDLYLFYQWAS